MFSIMFISSMVFGRIYCATICPWGACQETLGLLIQKNLKPQKKTRNRKIKYIVFILWIAAIILAVISAGGYKEIDLAFPGGFISIDGVEVYFYWFLILGLIGLFILVAGTRGFCNYACPMGVIGIIGAKMRKLLKYPSLHIESDASKCVSCKQCTAACVMSLDVHELVVTGDVNVADCINCGACTSACKTQAIYLSWKWDKKKTGKKENERPEGIPIKSLERHYKEIRGK